jgi:hypothetical protein
MICFFTPASDQYFLPKSYVINENNTHFDDTSFTGQYQKEVYMLARSILRKMTKLRKNSGQVSIL